MTHWQQRATDSVVLAPLAASATTARTANIDCIGADYATIRVVITSEANTNSTNVVLQLSESDDTTASNFATFNSSFNRTVDNTNAIIAVNHVDLKGRKRYLRLTVTPDTTTNGAVNVSASASLQRERFGSNASNVVVG